MVKLTIRALLMIASIYLSIKYIDGVTLVAPDNEFLSRFTITVLLFLLGEVIVYPILNAFFFPLRILTLGLASIFLSMLIIYFIANFYEPFIIDSLFEVLVLAVIFAIVRFGTD